MPSALLFPLTNEEIRMVARAALVALRRHDLQACVVGSTACVLYGMKNRAPNDVDIMVATNDMDTETIKTLVVSSNPSFYLRPSINPLNSYRVLWYKIYHRRNCKVDILIPSIFSLSRIPADRIFNINPFQDIPVIMFLLLLLLKLKGWADHGVDGRTWVRDKVAVDVKDINELVKLGAIRYQAHIDKEEWLSRSSKFVEESKERVHRYIKEWPNSARYWRDMGF